MIYLSQDIYNFDLAQALAQASPQRREYALRYRQELDQRRCMAAYRLLQESLRADFGIDEVPEFVFNAQGKPLLLEHPGIHFSLSHCREAVAVAIDLQPVGIDIETVDHYSEEVARRVMSEGEMRQILSAPRPEVAFTKLWTMKESLYKLTGDDHGGDIAHMLDNVTNYEFKTLDYPNFVLTTCQHSHADGLDL